MTRVAGYTSTGSKQPHVLFGEAWDEMPGHMVASHGCLLRDDTGRDYLDFVMALGAVALGYGSEDVVSAAHDAMKLGGIGALAPAEEVLLAEELHEAMPWLESVRFLKTGAEAVAAAVRLARTATGRHAVITCGYHGWLDWCSTSPGVPGAVQALTTSIPFNDVAVAAQAIRALGDGLACVVVEPIVNGPPALEWLTALRTETERVGAILIFDEVKTAFRLRLGGAVERFGVVPDLTVLGKAMSNGFALAAVGGRDSVMAHVRNTWISSTLATEFVSLAAARATLHTFKTQDVCGHLERQGAALFDGLGALAAKFAHLGVSREGVPVMCHLAYADDALSARVARACADRGLLFKRSGYNFVSYAHQSGHITTALDVLDEVLSAC